MLDMICAFAEHMAWYPFRKGENHFTKPYRPSIRTESEATKQTLAASAFMGKHPALSHP